MYSKQYFLYVRQVKVVILSLLKIFCLTASYILDLSLDHLFDIIYLFALSTPTVVTSLGFTTEMVQLLNN